MSLKNYRQRGETIFSAFTLHPYTTKSRIYYRWQDTKINEKAYYFNAFDESACTKDCPVYESFSMGIIITPSYSFIRWHFWRWSRSPYHPTSKATRNVKRKRRKKVFYSFTYVFPDNFLFFLQSEIYSISNTYIYILLKVMVRGYPVFYCDKYIFLIKLYEQIFFQGAIKLGSGFLKIVHVFFLPFIASTNSDTLCIHQMSNMLSKKLANIILIKK